jgi:hypothetical protein
VKIFLDRPIRLGKSEAMEFLKELECEGFVVVPSLVSTDEVDLLLERLKEAVTRVTAHRRGQHAYAMRNFLRTVPGTRQLAESAAVRSLVEPVLGLDWHQDLTIAVRRRIDLSGFGAWSVKEGVQHVRPPVELLERMLTMRLHLDDCGEENGLLRVLPGSHRHGKLDANAIRAWRAEVPAVSCAIKRGGVVLMRPLLLHASSPARRPEHRRVIHLEFAAEALPDGLQWMA